MPKRNLLQGSRIVSLFISLLLLCISAHAWAMPTFVVKKIDIQGNHRITRATIMTYLPVKVGEEMNDVRADYTIDKLFETEFFDHIFLTKKNNTLVIHVLERPTIAKIQITGNKKLTSTQLTRILKSNRLSSGLVYNTDQLNTVERGLIGEYNNLGYYSATIETHVDPLPQNRVALTIVIHEGKLARIAKISFVGNHTFSDSTLRSLLEIQVKSPISYFTGKDQFKSESMKKSVEAVHDYYLNHGYAKFKLESIQTSISENHRDIYITFNIHEGEKYHFSGFDVIGDKLILTQDEYHKLIPITPDQVFSRSILKESIDLISEALGNHGYGMPVINIEPVLNDSDKTVFMHFHINAGQIIYVRRISFNGNVKTADYVLRRALSQKEGTVLLTDKIKYSERSLKTLGYIKNIKMTTKSVPGLGDQVDLDYHIEEDHSTQAMIAVSYSQAEGLTGKASYSQHNFRGTGNQLGLDFKHSKFGETYSYNYFNPYYTPTGIGRGYSVFYQRHTTNDSDISNFAINKFGLGLRYSFPLSHYAAAHLGIGYQNLNLKLGFAAAPQYTTFGLMNGTNFNEAMINLGLHYNSYDRFPFPTSGINSQLSALVALGLDPDSLNYYKLTYAFRGYKPLPYGFIATVLAQAGYGNSFNSAHTEWPFFENFFAGGYIPFGQIRGFDSYSVGPKVSFTNRTPIGGNAVLSAMAGMILPYPISNVEHGVRTTVFIEGANAYQKDMPLGFQGLSGGEIRYSYGIALHWRSPFGLITFSLAEPINKQFRDRTKVFQFSLSSGF